MNAYFIDYLSRNYGWNVLDGASTDENIDDDASNRLYKNNSIGQIAHRKRETRNYDICVLLLLAVSVVFSARNKTHGYNWLE